MDESRRNFLKAAGVGAAGVAWGIPVVSAIAKALNTGKMPNALTTKRWAIMIDIEKCSQPEVIEACQKACHRIHNVPHVEGKNHEIKWIWQTTYSGAFPDQAHEYTAESLKKAPVMVLCNHCDRPPCVRVCPTQATFQREDGIVMMDQHRCIGCRYCMAACPYGARSFNWKDPRQDIENVREDFPTRTKGVVEKCNLCAERLAQGLEPACVEAANRVAGEDAMLFGDLGDPGSRISRVLRSKNTIRRKLGLGTQPSVFYVLPGPESIS